MHGPDACAPDTAPDGIPRGPGPADADAEKVYCERRAAVRVSTRVSAVHEGLLREKISAHGPDTPCVQTREHAHARVFAVHSTRSVTSCVPRLMFLSKNSLSPSLPPTLTE